MSVPLPPISVSTLLTVPVLAPLASVNVLLPAPRSTDMLAVSAVPSVMVSLPVPPAMVSVLATVAVLVKSPKVSVSLPAPRSMLALFAAVPSVTVSAPVPPISVFDVADRAGVGAVRQRQRVGAAAEIDLLAVGQRSAAT